MVWLVEFDLSGSQFAGENGHKVATTRNTSAITASANLGSHTFEFDDLDFELTDIIEVVVHAELTPSMTLTDEPPAASHTTSITCVSGLPRATVVLESTATDPDSDLDFELWWLDGVLRKVGPGPWNRVLANGSYTLEHRVFDLRGGYDNSVSTINVSCP